MVFVGLRVTQNGLESEVMEVCNSLTFCKLYGATVAQRRRCPIFGTDNGDFFSYIPLFCRKTVILVDILQYY